MEVAPFFCRFSPFFIDFHDLRTFVAIYILSRFTHFFRNFFLAKITFTATSHVFCMYANSICTFIRMVFVFTLWKYFQDDPRGVHPWEAKEEVENCAEVGEQVASIRVVGFLVEKMVKMRTTMKTIQMIMRIIDHIGQHRRWCTLRPFCVL